MKNKTEGIIANIESVVIGKTEEIKIILSALLAGGHVLLEDVPGTGKTVLAKALAKSFACDFSRIQFTPDLLPSELTGINFYSVKTGEFTFRKGSLFSNIVLGDEINRATPRTQSGLLEAMEERQITVDGTTYALPAPYFVIATQNPIETQGTFPLPEAQLDRFIVQLKLGYPTTEENVAIAKRFVSGEGNTTITKRFVSGEENTAIAKRFVSGQENTDIAARDPLGALSAVCTQEDLLAMQAAVKNIFIHDIIFKYIVDLAEATRTHEAVTLGVSTRGILALAKMAQAWCCVNGTDFVTPKDIQTLLPYVFGHRLVMKGGVGRRTSTALTVLEEIRADIAAPVEDWKNTGK